MDIGQELVQRQPVIALSRGVRARRRIGVVLAAIAMSLAAALPAHATAPAPELTLQAALDLMPDTYGTRASGVWYADYARAERLYGVRGLDSMTDPRIDRYFTALLPLRPGPETGVSGLTMGRWRQVYGYDLLEITSEIYSLNAAHGFVGVDVGRLDTPFIAHVLATSGYSDTIVAGDRMFVRMPTLFVSMPSAALNAVALGPGRVVAGIAPADVTATTLRLQRGYGTLGRDGGYRALAAALGPVQGAYLAANVPPSPFPAPRDGHDGPPLRYFGLYALAYQEFRLGHPILEIALAYSRPVDAAADAPTLRARLQHESLSMYGAPWSGVAGSANVSVHGNVLLARLPLRATTPPTFWLDAITAHDLSILSH